MSPPRNDLARLLAQRIEDSGPISVADYMATALGHPQFGYYMGKDPFGVAGDFTTAPEISQVFGELVGLWCANSWLALGKPTPFIFAELGPGRGTLMADALRALETVPACCAAARVHLVERSPCLRERQRQALPEVEVTWHDTIDDLPMLPAIFVANEFFDALPIEQFVRQDDGWHQRMVAQGPVHFAGAPVDLDAIRSVAARHGVAVIEDAAHAVGATYKSVPVGRTGTAVFSLHAIKNVTTGEGGVVCSDDAAMLERIKRMRFHGLGVNAFDRLSQGRAPQAEVVEPGYKMTLPDLNAAMGNIFSLAPTDSQSLFKHGFNLFTLLL